MNIRGEFESIQVSMVEVVVTRCYDQQYPETCAPKNEIDEFFKVHLFMMWTMKDVVDFENIQEPMS